MAKKTQQVLVAVDNCIFTVAEGRLDVLLIQMKQDPFHGVWALPGGLIDDGERLDGAASRILEEQTGRGTRAAGSSRSPISHSSNATVSN